MILINRSSVSKMMTKKMADLASASMALPPVKNPKA